mmetsp:Transcript_6477/g.9853  ORF Transcript_6477/g.9853 Transcript_6477/m.9853 type:complete len:216 (+) Transcript_6477:76-723(+)
MHRGIQKTKHRATNRVQLPRGDCAIQRMTLMLQRPIGRHRGKNKAQDAKKCVAFPCFACSPARPVQQNYPRRMSCQTCGHSARDFPNAPTSCRCASHTPWLRAWRNNNSNENAQYYCCCCCCWPRRNSLQGDQPQERIRIRGMHPIQRVVDLAGVYRTRRIRQNTPRVYTAEKKRMVDCSSSFLPNSGPPWCAHPSRLQRLGCVPLEYLHRGNNH